ncbi:MAG: DUF86 domain-containing protein, partial [bacterium]|nr:DUF86 domain-containing protein [bacterium]
ERQPDVDWRDIVAFRNIAVHAYFSVDWSIVWTTATEDAPALRERVEKILAETEDVPNGRPAQGAQTHLPQTGPRRGRG